MVRGLSAIRKSFFTALQPLQPGRVKIDHIIDSRRYLPASPSFVSVSYKEPCPLPTRTSFLPGNRSAHLPTKNEQDVVLPLAMRRRGLQEPDVLHARRRPRQGHLERLQLPPVALRRRRRVHAQAPQARVDARGDVRDLQSHGHVALLPHAETGVRPRGPILAVANTGQRTRDSANNPTATAFIAKTV